MDCKDCKYYKKWECMECENKEMFKPKLYWIDGFFHRDWNKKAYFSHDRGVYIPIFATKKIEKNRIYIKKDFALKILRAGRVFDSTNRNDMFDFCLKNIINVPWSKVYNPPFEVSF